MGLQSPLSEATLATPNETEGIQRGILEIRTVENPFGF
jgi:hypothetical protein